MEKVQMVGIDFFATAESVVKGVLLLFVYVVALLAFALSAPLLFTVGAEWLAWRYPGYASTWGVAYLASGPVACAVWMSILSHWYDWVAEWKARKAGVRVVRTWGDREAAFGKGVGFMFAGLVGSFLAEGAFTYAAHALSVVPGHLMLYFAAAPLAVFAPCWIVLLVRWLRG